MNRLPVLFREDDIVPMEHTSAGVGIGRRGPRSRRVAVLQRLIAIHTELSAGRHLEAFDAGIYDDTEAA